MQEFFYKFTLEKADLYGVDPMELFSTDTGKFLDHVSGAVVDGSGVNIVVVIDCDHQYPLVLDGVEHFAMNLSQRVFDICTGGKRIGFIKEEVRSLVKRNLSTRRKDKAIKAVV